MIPLSAPDITESEIAAVVEVLRSPSLSLGPRIPAFEAAFTALTGVPNAIAVSSGTAGLHLALLSLGIGPGDEVLVPSFTFIAAANVIRYVGATPVFVEIDPITLNLTPATVELRITAKTRAIMAVHTFGLPAPIRELGALAQAHSLFLIEDACEALGATVAGRPIGTFGHAAVFAFYPNKQITTGEGGMVLTPDPGLAARIRALRNHGRAPGSTRHTLLGYNYRLSDIACALGLGQMQRLPEILARREQIAHTYNKLLAAEPNLQLPVTEVPGTRISWFVYVIRLAPHLNRDAVMESLAQQSIASGVYFAAIHLQPAYADFHAVQLPVTESMASRTIALPFFNRITNAQIEHVAQSLLAAINSPAASRPAQDNGLQPCHNHPAATRL